MFYKLSGLATSSPAVANKDPSQNTKQLLVDAISGIKERWLHPYIFPTSWENIMSQFEEDCSRTLKNDLGIQCCKVWASSVKYLLTLLKGK